LNDFSEGAARMVAKIIQEQEEACDPSDIESAQKISSGTVRRR